MEENNPVGGVKFGFSNQPGTTDVNKGNSSTLPVEGNEQKTATAVVEEGLDDAYTDNASVTIALVTNFSLYRKANAKTLPKKRDYIGSSVSASRVLSSNKEEIEHYFPTIIGLAPNHDDFVSRIKQYLNNIRVPVDELGKKFDISFIFNKKSDYYKFKAQQDKIEEVYSKVNRNNISELKAALKEKVTKLNTLESDKFKIGRPVNVDDYLMYRHCLLYNDIAKDVALINVDPFIRFYFKDDQKEAEKLRKHRIEINKAKTNYVSALADDVLFESIYTQYLVLNERPVIAGLLESTMDKEVKLDKFSSDEPVKFNKMFSNKDAKLIGIIELLIAHNELMRSPHNQNISTSEGQFIGSNINEAIAWFKQPDNNSTVQAYYSKLKNI